MSESKLKTISINPDIFSSFGGSNTRKKKPEKPLKVKEPSRKSDKTRKNEILRRIRENQEKKYKTLFDGKEQHTENTAASEFNNSFDESVKFMETVVENREKANLNQTLKNREQPNNIPQSLLFNNDPSLSKLGDNFNIIDTIDTVVESVSNPFVIPPQPKYGCLKGGTLPTYRNYTVKNFSQPSLVQPSAVVHQPMSHPSAVVHQPMSHPSAVVHQPSSMQPILSQPMSQPNILEGGTSSVLTPAPKNTVGRIRSPGEIVEMKKLREASLEAKKNKQNIVPKKVKKLMKRTYRVGRDKYKPAVGVLLPNKTIKNNVTTTAYMLKQTPIAEVRKFLLKTGFIKVGSAAPNDVLRKIYESIKLIDGDVKNYNPDNLLYNFFNDNAK
jgi:hypothetical protein